MPTGRVVIRSSWRSIFAQVAVTLAVLVIVRALWGPWGASIGPLVAVLVFVGVFQRINKVVLTAEGLAFGKLGPQFIPWNHIGSVEPAGTIGNRGLAVFDVHENRRRWLPAPRVAFRVGTDEVAAAKALIEEFWTAYRGSAPLPPAPLRPPGFVPGAPTDPYAPPADG